MGDDFKNFRRIQIKKNLQNPFMLDHYQIHNWKDQDMFEDSWDQDLFKFLRIVSGLLNDLYDKNINPTVLIHCKAGIGWSGTFLGTLFLFDLMEFWFKLYGNFNHSQSQLTSEER